MFRRHAVGGIEVAQVQAIAALEQPIQTTVLHHTLLRPEVSYMKHADATPSTAPTGATCTDAAVTT